MPFRSVTSKMALRVFTKLKPERFTDDQKAQIINECVDDQVSPVELAKKYSVNADTIRAWVRRAGKALPKWYRYQPNGQSKSCGKEFEDEEDDHNYVNSVQNFWEKALAEKCSDFPVRYEVREGSVSCSIGQLRVEREGASEEEARQNAAAAMLNKIENILEGRQDIVRIIKAGHETQQDSANPPFRDETVFSEEEEEEARGPKGHAYQEEVVGSSEDELADSRELVSAAPATKAEDSQPLETEMMPGAEYCLGLLRTDRPGE